MSKLLKVAIEGTTRLLVRGDLPVPAAPSGWVRLRPTLALAIGAWVLVACSGSSAPIEAPSTEATQQLVGQSPAEDIGPVAADTAESALSPVDAPAAGDAEGPAQGGYIPQPGSSTADLKRSDSQGAVEVTVVPSAWTLDADGTIEFQVSMNTHSVDLSMDLAKLSTLQTDTGVTLQALDWSGGSGHHVIGLLRFPAGTPEGGGLLQQAKQLILTIRQVDAPAREFSWEVALLP